MSSFRENGNVFKNNQLIIIILHNCRLYSETIGIFIILDVLRQLYTQINKTRSSYIITEFSARHICQSNHKYPFSASLGSGGHTRTPPDDGLL